MRPAQTPPPSSRIPGLDLLRAIAIVWVLLFHARVLRLGTTVEPISRYGWFGVDLFFALSGYLIGTQWFAQLTQPGAFAGFYLRRFFRIIPAYSVVVAVYFGLPWLREASGIMPLWQFASFTENLFITFDQPRAFTHVWSLCVEEHFYLLFPLLSLGLLRARLSRWAPLFLAVLFVGGAALRWYIFTTQVMPSDDPGTTYFERIYYPTYTRLDGLLFGVVAAAVKVFRPRWFASLVQRQWALLLVTAVTLGAAFTLFSVQPPTLAAVVAGFPLIAVGMTALVIAATQWQFRVPLAPALAAGAYSLYLSHKLALAFVRDHWGAALKENDWLAFAAYAAATLLVGAALHHLVERPFLSLRADRLRSQRPVAAESV